MKKNKKQKNIKGKIGEEKLPWQHKVVEYLSYLTVFLVPLVFSLKHLFVFNTPKILVILLIVPLMLILYLWGNWLKRFNFKFSILSIVLIIFTTVLTLSSILGVDKINSFFGWLNIFPLVGIYALVVFSFIVGNLIRKDRSIIIKLLLVSFITSILIMVFFYTGLGKDVDLSQGSTLKNSSYLGLYILFNFFFSLGLLFYYKKIWLKILVLLGSLFLVISPLFINKNFLLGKISLIQVFNNPLSLLGIANGATMGIGLSLIFIGFLFLTISKKKILKVIGLILIIGLLSGIYFVGRQLTNTETELNKVFVETKSGNRFLAWDIAKEGFKDSPVLGNGFNNYVYNFDKYFNPKLYQDGYIVERFLKPHNVFWEYASETGILGLVSYLSLLIILFVTLYRFKPKDDKEERLKYLFIVLSGIILGYFVQNLLIFDSVATYLMLFIVVSIGLGISRYYEFKLKDNYNWINKILIICGIIFAVWSLFALSITPSIESKNYVKSYLKNENIKDDLLNKSKFFGVMEHNYLASGILDVYQENINKIKEENKEKFFEKTNSSVKLLEEGILKQPNYSEAYLSVSKIINLQMMIEMEKEGRINFTGENYDQEKWQKSYDFLMKSLELNLNNPGAQLVGAQLYLIKTDFDKAIEYNMKAINIAPDFEESYKFGRFLLKAKPDLDFEKYINDMENKYLKD